MEGRQILLSAMNLQEVLSEPLEVSYAVEVVLKKIEAAERNRCKRDVAENLQMILNSVNMALHHMWQGISDEGLRTVLEETEENRKERQLNEKKTRAKELLSIKTFLESSVEREVDLGLVLEWLLDTQNDLQDTEQDVEFKDVREMTVEWIEEIQDNIHRCVTEIQTCLSRLHHLCGCLFGLESKKKATKHQQDAQKGSVWRWWRETKVDAKTVFRIQELQPPSAEQILADDSLGTRMTSDLIFMLGDMTKFLSCSKAMATAFKFAQAGLTGLSKALAERTNELRSVRADTDTVRTVKVDLGGTRHRSTRQEMERNTFPERSAPLEKGSFLGRNSMQQSEYAEVLQVREKLEPGVSRADGTGSLPPGREGEARAPQTQPKPKPPKAALPPPPTKRPKQEVTSAPTADGQPGEPSPSAHPEPCLPPSPSPDVADYEGEEETTTNEEETAAVGPAQSLEQRTRALMASFQSSMMGIFEDAVLPQDSDPASGRTGKEAVKLHQDLAHYVQEAFARLHVMLDRKFTRGILDMPFAEASLDLERQTGLWEGEDLSPSEMLTEIGELSLRHDEDLQKWDETVSGLMKDNQISAASQAEVTEALHRINDRTKEQACKMRLALDGLTELHLHLSPASGELDRGAETWDERPGRRERKTKRRTLEDVDEDEEDEEYEDYEDIRVERRRQRKYVPAEGSRVEVSTKRERSAGHSSKWALRPRQKRGADPSAALKRHRTEVTEELNNVVRDVASDADYVEETVMVDVPHHLGANSQKTNLHLLKRGLDGGAVSSPVHMMTSDLIARTGSVVEKRLVCLLRSYLALRAVQEVRTNLRSQLQSGRDLSEGRVMKQMHSMLRRLDGYERVVMKRWRRRREAITRARAACLTRMLRLYEKISEDCGVSLLPPLPCPSVAPSPGVMSVQATRKLLWTFSVPRGNPRSRTPVQRQRHDNPGPAPASAGAHGALHESVSRPTPEPRRAHSVPRCSTKSGLRRLLLNHKRASLWCDITAYSVSLGEKLPAAPATTDAAIPLLMEMDINQGRASALRSAHNRIGRRQRLLPRRDICSQ